MAALTPENSQFLMQQVAAGVFQSNDEALNAAVALLRRQSDLRTKVLAGVAQLDAGDYQEFDGPELNAYFAALMASSATSVT